MAIDKRGGTARVTRRAVRATAGLVRHGCN